MNSEITLQGNLNFLNLGEILQLIGSNGATGILRIISPLIEKPGLVYFDKGNIVNATTLNATGLEAVYELFGWLEGHFEFFRKESINITRKIQNNRMEIILDGLRKLDEGDIIRRGAPSSQSSHLEKAEEQLPLIRGPLVDYTYIVEEEHYAQRETFVKENSYGDWVWVVLDGQVNVVKETPHGPLTLLRLGPGALIGSLFNSFSFQSNFRAFAAETHTDVRLGVLDTMRISREMTPTSFNFRKLLLSLENRTRQLLEQAVRVPDERHLLLSDPSHRVIVPQGYSEPVFHQITAGQAEVISHGPKVNRLLVRLDAGDFVGRMPLWNIGHEPQAAGVYGTVDCQTQPLHPDEYAAEYESLPMSLKNMIEYIVGIIPVLTRRLHDIQP